MKKRKKDISYPISAKVATRIFSIAVINEAVEREFSLASNIATQKPDKLSPTINVDRMVQKTME